MTVLSMTAEQARELADRELNEAIARIQKALGQKYGDFASVYFTGENEKLYNRAVDMLADYVAAESGFGAPDEEQSNLRLVETCGACPEQYDVFDGEKLVGYLRLRHGYFQARFGDVDGPVVYDAHTRGDGMFERDEREYHLEKAKSAIRAETASKQLGS